MRHFHITRNLTWRPTINIEKLWTLVPKEEKEGLTEGSDVVPVIDLLHHGYAKLLGNGQCVLPLLSSEIGADGLPRLPKLPFIVKTRYVSKIAEWVSICALCLPGADFLSGTRSRRLAAL
jgi:large subunit ribosomal protein L27Ae